MAGVLFPASLAGWRLQARAPCQQCATTEALRTMLAVKAAKILPMQMCIAAQLHKHTNAKMRMLRHISSLFCYPRRPLTSRSRPGLALSARHKVLGQSFVLGLVAQQAQHKAGELAIQ